MNTITPNPSSWPTPENAIFNQYSIRYPKDWMPATQLSPAEYNWHTCNIAANLIESLRNILEEAEKRANVGRTPIREAEYQAHVADLRTQLRNAQRRFAEMQTIAMAA